MTPTSAGEKNLLRIQLAAPFAIFLCLAGGALTEFFTGDDVMNLFRYLQHPASWWVSALTMFWSSEGYRPLGGIAYVAIYKAFGFYALPFKVFVLVAFLLNLVLCRRVSLKLSQSRTIALWTILFCSYHAAFDGLWLNFGAVYDVLAYSCFFGALMVYTAWARDGRRSARGVAAVVLLYLTGLELKEIVVTLPAVLMLWAVLFTRAAQKERWRWPVESGLPILVCLALGAIYVAGKLRGPESLIINPAYTPHFTWPQFSTVNAHYIRQIFYLPVNSPAPFWGVIILASMILAGLLLRSRLMIFCAASILITQIPVSFIAPRGAFAIYIPWTFWGIYAAAAVERITRLFRSPRYAFGLWALAAVALVVVHIRMKPRYDPLYTVQAASYEAFSKNLDAWHVHIPENGRVLLVSDAFPSWWIPWDPMFLINLRDHTRETVVDRLKLDSYLPPDAERAKYGYVIDYDAAWLLLKRPGAPLIVSPHLRDLPAQATVQLCEGFLPPNQGLVRETAPVFTIQTHAPDARPHQLAVSLLSYEPATLSVQLDDGPVHPLGVQPVPNVELKLPIPAAAAGQRHTWTFHGGSADRNNPAHLFLTDVRLQ